MAKTTVKPPEQFLDWFLRSKNGVWVFSDLQGLIDRIEKWAKGRGMRTYWLLTPRDRRSIKEWINQHHQVGWSCIERLTKWSGLPETYWLGPRPEVETILPYREDPQPEKLAQNKTLPPLEQPPAIPAAAVVEYDGPWFVNNSHGTRVLALGLIPGFISRFDSLYGLTNKKSTKLPEWLGKARWAWETERSRPSEDIIKKICDWSKTNLKWWVVGKGPRDISPPAPPKATSKAPRADNAPPEKPQKAPESETAYNFFADCFA